MNTNSRPVIVDLLYAILFDVMWILTTIELSGWLYYTWLEKHIGWLSFLIPIIVFAVGLLIILFFMSIRCYIIIAVGVVAGLLFPFLVPFLKYGAHLWCMNADLWAAPFGRYIQIAFWISSIIIQSIVTCYGSYRRERLNHSQLADVESGE